MLTIRVIALVLILASAVGISYSGFDEVKSAQPYKSTRSEFTLSGADVPMWTGVAGMLLGGLLLVGFGARR